MNPRVPVTVLLLSLGALGSVAVSRAATGDDPLPSWRDGDTKAAITDFVERVTDADAATFVPPAERVAVFDNDGTLWAEQPVYFQALYAFDRVKEMAADHPEWRTTEPFKSVLADDIESALAGGVEDLLKVVMASHANVTAEEFADSARRWLATAKHPETGLLYTDMTYRPMVELLEYLRANGFKTYIVSGGGIDFLRVFAEEAYGIPPEQVIGTTADAEFEMRDGVPTIVKQGKIALIDDKEGKPVGIYQYIGRRPLLAGGNSDGDLAMLQYTTIPRDEADTRPRFGLLVRHTDGEREWAYDRESHVGRLDTALDEAGERGWTVVDMAEDWARVYSGSAD